MSEVGTITAVSPSSAAEIAALHFGVVGTAHRLPGDKDQNFLLRRRDGARAILKVASADSADAIAFQHVLLGHLASVSGSIPEVPRVIPPKGPDSVEIVVDDISYLCRMLTYIEGTLLGDTKPHEPGLLESVGEVLGRIDNNLAGFDHPSMHRELSWDIRHVTETVRPSAFGHDAQRALVEEALARYSAWVVPVLDDLPKSVIQNDANDYNLVVGQYENGGRCCVGVIDFGDAVHTATVFEAAIAATYVMLDKPDPVTAAAHVVRGYCGARPLEEIEADVLFGSVLARLAISVFHSTRALTSVPENAYAQISATGAWALLESLLQMPGGYPTAVLRTAAGFAPSRRCALFTDWLSTTKRPIGRIVDQSLEEAAVLDLSVSGSDVDPTGDLESWTSQLDAHREDAGADVLIGRYNEARLAYQSAAFSVRGNDREIRRTIHLGVDVFLPPATPVLTPMPGRIHSKGDHAGAYDYGPTLIVEHDLPNASGASFYTLYGHLSRTCLDELAEGQELQSGDRLGEIGTAEENGGWPPHLHFQIVTDLLGYEAEFPGVARPDEREMWLQLCPDPNHLLGTPKTVEAPSATTVTLLAKRKRHLGPSLSLSYRLPLHIVRGIGAYLFDATGQAYLDCVNNVCHVGHCHPRVVNAIARQAAVLNTNTRYLHENLSEYAERLTATLPDSLDVCYFVCSGSEANDLALRLAHAYTSASDVVVIDGAYHGNLSTLIDLSPYKFDGPGGSGSPGHVHVVPSPDPYRGQYRNDDAPGKRYADHLAAAVEEIRRSGRTLAAFFAESLLGCGGQIVPPEGYFKAAYKTVREAGGVCVADEVQVGFGRLGTHFWGFETHGVVPDIVTMGKPIGNGHPLGAVVTTREIADAFDNGMEYFNTFGGNPVSCAAGMAVLDVISEERLMERARQTGSFLLTRLREMQVRHPVVGDVRGIGLFIGIELVENRTTLTPAAHKARYVVERMKDCGILLSTDGPLHNVIKFKPPLVFGMEEANRFLQALDRVLGEDFMRVDRLDAV